VALAPPPPPPEAQERTTAQSATPRMETTSPNFFFIQYLHKFNPAGIL
jgi:hypothetical protein